MNMTIGADDKKKLIALGVLVVAVIGVLIFVFTRGKSSSTETAQAPPPGLNPDMPPGMPGAPGDAPVENAAPAGGGGGGNVTAASFASLSGPRADPFTPQYILPPPPPPPPLQLPQPEALPTPQGGTYAGLGLPPAYVATNTSANVMKGLPPIIIPKLRNVSASPQKFEAPKQSGGSSLATPSFNKRLSGVIIGDSVHALLEVSGPSGTQTFVVQPGDTVAGIRILSIQRVDMGGKTVPRMLISENGEQKYVDLRASFNPQTDMQPQGMNPEGMPGGYPGNPAIIPAPNIPPQQKQAGHGTNPFSAY